MTNKQEIQLGQIKQDKPSKSGLFERLYAGKAPRSVAIKCACYLCTYFDQEWINECPSNDCPLWRFRPVSKGKKCT